MYSSESGRHLYQFYKQKEEIFLKNYLIILQKPTVESFHDFRVSVKRIRAVFRLIENMESDFNASKQIKPYREVYNPTGKIREIQVSLKTIKSFQLMPQSMILFKEYCNAKEKKYLERLREKLLDFDQELFKKTRKKIKKYCKGITQEKILESAEYFIKDRIANIQESIAKSNDDVSTHQARISLKEISAVIMLLRKMQFSGFDSGLLELLKATEDKLGRWHDKVDLSSFIEKFLRSTELASEINEDFRAIQVDLLKQNKKFIAQIGDLMLSTINVIEQRIKVV